MKKNFYGLFLLLIWQMIMSNSTLRGQTQSMYLIRGSEAHSMHYFKQAKAPADIDAAITAEADKFYSEKSASEDPIFGEIYNSMRDFGISYNSMK